MSILKKWLGCIASFIAGVCGLALSACTGMIVKGSIDLTALGMGKNNVESITKAYKVLTDSKLYTDAKEAGIGTEFVWMKVFAIFTLIVSILLIVYAIIMLLKNLNVIKSESKVFNIVGLSLVALLLVSTIGLLVTSNIYADATINLVKSQVPSAIMQFAKVNVNANVGFYQPAMLVVSIVTAVAFTAGFVLNRKKV